jgi:hypothetical protein
LAADRREIVSATKMLNERWLKSLLRVRMVANHKRYRRKSFVTTPEQHHPLSALHMQLHAAMQQAHNHLEHYDHLTEGESGHIALMESLHAVHHHLKEAHRELEKYSKPHEHEHHESH